jgi:streptomycin 6-kinase
MSELLEKYIKEWKLENSKKLISTFTSDVYLCDSNNERVVLKILNETGIKDELPGIYFLKSAKGNGCVSLHEFDERALLIEYLPGESLYQYSKAGKEKEASKIFCEIIKKLKSVPRNNYSVKLTYFISLFEIFNRVKVQGDIKGLLEQAHYLAQKLVSTQSEEVLLHGDLHHENIISRRKGDFACFDPKGFVGDPSYELGTTLKNPWDYPEISQNIEIFKERAKFFSNELGLPYERIVGFAFVHLCLSIAWAIDDNCNYDHQLTLAQKVSNIL